MSKSDLEAALEFTLRAASVPPPIPEWKFALPRQWRFDYAWPDRKVAVEVDGGTWVHGRHSRATGQEKDMEKNNAAAIAGWLVIHVTGAMIEDGRALAVIEAALAARRD